MFSSHQSAPSTAHTSLAVDAASPAWPTDFDDMALGCECADPALQIACWSHEAQPLHAGTAD